MRQENPMGYERIDHLLRRFAVPSIVSMLVTSLYNLVDQIFIGQRVGLLGNGATSVAFPLTTICLAIALLIGIGSASKFSLELGASHQDEAEQCIGDAFFLSLTMGLLFFFIVYFFKTPMLKAFGATRQNLPYAVTYVTFTNYGMPFLIMTNVMSNLIRADGSPRFSMICMVVGAVLNTILDPLLMFGLNMGIEGAAIATSLSQLASFIIGITYFKRLKTVQFRIQDYVLDLRRALHMASFGLSASLNQVAMVIMQIVLNNSLLHYGAFSPYGTDIPISTAGIVAKVYGIILAVFIGLAQGMQPLIGYNYGARKYDRVKEIFMLAIKTSFVVSIAAFAVFQLFARPIISLFGSGDAAYYTYASSFLRTWLFMVIIVNVPMLSVNFFSALGKPMKGVMIALTRQLLIIVPLLIILPRFFGLMGIRFAMPITDAAACLLSAILIKQEFALMAQMTLPDDDHIGDEDVFD